MGFPKKDLKIMGHFKVSWDPDGEVIELNLSGKRHQLEPEKAMLLVAELTEQLRFAYDQEAIQETDSDD